MTLQLAPRPATGHPAVAVAVAEVHAALDRLGEVEGAIATVPAGELAALVARCARARVRLQALELALVAAAEHARVPALAGARSTGSWLAAQTHADQSSGARDARLAVELASLPATAEVLAAGEVTAEHARVIAEAVRRLPPALTPDQRDRVERSLVDHARRLAPAALRRRARRALAAVDPEAVDGHEDALLRAEESAARDRTRLTLHDNGDGTTTGRFTVPTLAASILSRTIQQLASPRRDRQLGAGRSRPTDDGAAPDWAHRHGLAFLTLLEHLPTDHLHGRVAATIVVTLDQRTLTEGLRAAGLDTGERISAGQARRLACQAGVVPAVLGGASQVLDLGRSRRLFTQAQRLAGALRHTTCAARGCETPYAWAELHHRRPWSRGGRTDLDELLPLCSWHHHRIHDPDYTHHTHRDRTLSFHRRT